MDKRLGMRTLLGLGLWAGAMVACAAQVLSMPIVDAPPYGWQDAKGQPQGLYPEVAAALGREAGLPMKIEVVPFARAATLVASGNADATMMFSNAHTSGKAIEARVMFYFTQIVQLRPGLKIGSRRELDALQIGRINGGCRELADDSSVAWRFTELNTQESGLRMLLAGRIDGFCSTTEALSQAQLQSGLQLQFAQAQQMVLGSKPVWLLLSPRLPAPTAARLDAAARQIQRSGELARIFKSVLGPGYVPNLPVVTAQ